MILSLTAVLFAFTNLSQYHSTTEDINLAGRQRMKSQQLLLWYTLNATGTPIDHTWHVPPFSETMKTLRSSQQRISDKYSLGGLAALEACAGAMDVGNTTASSMRDVFRQFNIFLDEADSNVKHIVGEASQNTEMYCAIIVALGTIEAICIVILMLARSRSSWVDRVEAEEKLREMQEVHLRAEVRAAHELQRNQSSGAHHAL